MKTQFVHLGVLFFMLLVGGGTFWYLNGSPGLQLFVGIATSLAYILWGIIHHAIKEDLHKKVVVEYILIGCIAIIVLFIIVRG
jgi:hypothetical protein